LQGLLIIICKLILEVDYNFSITYRIENKLKRCFWHYWSDSNEATIIGV